MGPTSPFACRLLLHLLLMTLTTVSILQAQKCEQGVNCKLPDCFCSTEEHPLGTDKIPQIVYFGFDDAVQPQVSGYYNKLFTKTRKNPNGCPITMSLYVSHEYTVYGLVSQYYERGMEIAVHSVTHTDVDTAAKLMKEAKEQKENIEKLAGVPAAQVVGWRSPNLKTAGDDQPRVLTDLKYLYDISLTYSRDVTYTFPFTLDYGYPFPCTIQPCPGVSSAHKGFWEVMVHSMTDPATGQPCGYVDGCRPAGEDAALEYLWTNFLNAYNTNRAPFGLNMHAAWFATPDYMNAMSRFIDRMLTTPDVYIVNVRQMLEWMKNPVPLSEIKNFAPWGCKGRAGTIKAPPTPKAQIITKPTTSTTTTTSTKTVTPRRTLVSANGKQQNNSTLFSASRPNSFLTWSRQYKEQSSWPLVHVHSSVTKSSTPPPTTTPAVGRTLFWQNVLKSHSVEQRQTCSQEINCKKPQCYCRAVEPPQNLPTSAIVQVIYIAIDSRIDGRTFAPLLQIFSSNRKNPNGCPISGTVFTPSTGNYPPYVQTLQAKGVHIGVSAGTSSGLFSAVPKGNQIRSEISDVRRFAPSSRGWRGSASLAPTDTVFSELQHNGIRYDSSVMTNSIDMSWPYTLDYGLTADQCIVDSTHCPSLRYPGMWEVPIQPLIVPDSSITYGEPPTAHTCSYLDSCLGFEVTKTQVESVLNSNFQRRYYGNRSPFGINLQDSWFANGVNQDGLRGLMSFLDDVAKAYNVRILSVEQMLDWVITPDQDPQRHRC